jgi:hypothetical protein
MPTRPRRFHALVALSLLLTFELRAQAAGTGPHTAPAAPSRDCLASIPRSALRATVVHLIADERGEGVGPLSDLAWPTLRAFSDRIAVAMRSALGAPEGAVAARDSTLEWRVLLGHVHVAIARDGGFAWSYPWGSAGHRSASDSAAERGIALIVRALAEVQNAGGVLGWPAGLRGDSLAFRLRFAWPDPREDGSMGEMPVKHATPVLRALVPTFSPMRIVKRATIPYPESSRLAEVRTTITMQFLLDTAGRVDATSLRDRWPASQPRPSGKLANYYDEFVQVVRRGILTSTYEPARFGGCPVPQQVEQDFTFGLKGRIWNDNE